MPKTILVRITPEGKPLTAAERRSAIEEHGEIGAAVRIYKAMAGSVNDLYAQFEGVTEVELLESVTAAFDRVFTVDPAVARQLRRLVSLRVRGVERWLPKPTPFVVKLTLAVVTRSLGGTRPPPITTGESKTPISSREFVSAWALREWHASNPTVRLDPEQLPSIFSGLKQKKRATNPRPKRRSSDLKNAADALRHLATANPVRDHNLRDIAKTSGIKYERLRKLGLRNIRKAAR